MSYPDLKVIKAVFLSRWGEKRKLLYFKEKKIYNLHLKAQGRLIKTSYSLTSRRGGDGEAGVYSRFIPVETASLASPEEIRFLLPSPPWFETFQAAFLWEYMASGQSNNRESFPLA